MSFGLLPGFPLKKKCTTLRILKTTYQFQNLLLTNKYTCTIDQYWENVTKTFHDVCLHLPLSVIMNLNFRSMILRNFMTPRRDKFRSCFITAQ